MITSDAEVIHIGKIIACHKFLRLLPVYSICPNLWWTISCEFYTDAVIVKNRFQSSGNWFIFALANLCTCTRQPCLFQNSVQFVKVFRLRNQLCKVCPHIRCEISLITIDVKFCFVPEKDFSDIVWIMIQEFKRFLAPGHSRLLLVLCEFYLKWSMMTELSHYEVFRFQSRGASDNVSPVSAV